MIWRVAIGLVALLVGGVWIGQGIGSIHGSFMTGHAQYTGLGVVLVVIGLALIGWAVAINRRGRKP
jgi:hypothetical protein